MLELKEIKKYYQVGDIETRALDGISVAFRQTEFVAILGASGSGKTTCLNVIGGLDRYDSGDMVINGKSTKNFKAHDWDAYRNNTIGFIFQSYNLISHLSLIANVEMGMTLSGVSVSEKHRKAIEALEKVGLKDHIHKKPNQLSGGQMQRVAIARALANDPDILLCDEPTGALDTNTSIQIMDLIKEVSKDKLVIMVTHNPELAEKYADRTVKFQDGKIVSDTHPHEERPKEDVFKLKKTSMSFLTALKLSFNNIRTKLGRTFLTSFASSIGIIGIALILALSVGFKDQIDNFQSDTLAEYPITIAQQAMSMEKAMSQHMGNGGDYEEFPDTDKVYVYDKEASQVMHTNVFTDDYINYIEKIDSADCKSVGYYRTTGINMLTTSSDGTIAVGSNVTMSSYPQMLKDDGSTFLEENYDLLSGKYATAADEFLLVVDSKNRLDVKCLQELGYDVSADSEIKYDDLIGKEYKIVMNDDFYSKTDLGTYTFNTNYDELYKNNNNFTVKIVGIVREKEDCKLPVLSTGLCYSDELMKKIISINENSQIVKAQLDSNSSVLTMEKLDDTAKKQMITYLGGDSTPYMITVFPYNFDSKEAVLDYLDAYNEGKSEADTIEYTDMADTITGLTGNIMDGITTVLIAFAATSLIVSLIMISIIIYTSVLERTKEIGILKALGARKKDITRVFDAETFILGVFSGTLGIFIAFLLTFPINSIIYKVAELENVAYIKPSHAITLIIISTVLTMLGGHIPAKMAAKKDAVEALRSE